MRLIHDHTLMGMIGGKTCVNYNEMQLPELYLPTAFSYFEYFDFITGILKLPLTQVSHFELKLSGVPAIHGRVSVTSKSPKCPATEPSRP